MMRVPCPCGVECRAKTSHAIPLCDVIYTGEKMPTFVRRNLAQVFGTGHTFGKMVVELNITSAVFTTYQCAAGCGCSVYFAESGTRANRKFRRLMDEATC